MPNDSQNSKAQEILAEQILKLTIKQPVTEEDYTQLQSILTQIILFSPGKRFPFGERELVREKLQSLAANIQTLCREPPAMPLLPIQQSKCKWRLWPSPRPEVSPSKKAPRTPPQKRHQTSKDTELRIKLRSLADNIQALCREPPRRNSPASTYSTALIAIGAQPQREDRYNGTKWLVKEPRRGATLWDGTHWGKMPGVLIYDLLQSDNHTVWKDIEPFSIMLSIHQGLIVPLQRLGSLVLKQMVSIKDLHAKLELIYIRQDPECIPSDQQRRTNDAVDSLRRAIQISLCLPQDHHRPASRKKSKDTFQLPNDAPTTLRPLLTKLVQEVISLLHNYNGEPDIASLYGSVTLAINETIRQFPSPRHTYEHEAARSPRCCGLFLFLFPLRSRRYTKHQEPPEPPPGTGVELTISTTKR